MTRKILIFILNLSVILSANAQEKIKEMISTNYDRSSISIITLQRPNTEIPNYDYYIDRNDKFDYNVLYKNLETNKSLNELMLETSKLISESSFKEVVGKGPYYDLKGKCSYNDIINSGGFREIGKNIVSYIFNRNKNGEFSDTIIRQRGLYNANDQDVLNASVAKVNDLSFEWGEMLLNSAYLAVVDYSCMRSTSDNKGRPKYTVGMYVHVFKLNADREILDNFYEKAWIYDDMSDEEKKKAIENYENMQFSLTHLCTELSFGTSNSSKFSTATWSEACSTAFRLALKTLENKIPAWKTTIYISSTHPLEAKIGKKENVKNGDKFYAYSFKEDKSGEIKSVKRGAVRATVVSDNREVSTGASKTTRFYQTSGFSNIQEGYILKQKDDLGLGVALTVGTAVDGFKYGIDLDFILNVGKRGSITYLMLNGGYRKGSQMSSKELMIGLGYGIPCTRFLEVTPNLLCGVSLCKGVGQKFVIEPAVRLGLTLQPATIFINAGYQALSLKSYNSLFGELGFKWTF